MGLCLRRFADEGTLRWGRSCGAVDEDVLLLGWRLGSRGGSIGEKGEMDRRVLEQVLGRRAAQEAQQVRLKSLVKRNFAV